MFSTAVFCEAPAVTTAENVAPVVDPMFRKVSDDLIVPAGFNKVIALYAYGQSLQTAYINSPSLRSFSRVYIAPLNSEQNVRAGEFDGARQYIQLNDRHSNPVPLEVGEALNAIVENSEVHTGFYNMVAVWLADAPITPIVGADIRTIYATDTDLNHVIGAWVSGEMAFTPDLPVGTYQIVGARAWAGERGVFRFIFRDETNRPGALISPGKHPTGEPIFRMGRLGSWGTFHSTTPPMVETCVIQDCANGIYLRIDLRQIAKG